MKWLRVSVSLVVLLSLAACGGEGDGGPAPQPTAAERPTSTGEIAIVEPKPGATVDADDVTVRLDLTGATVVEEVSQNLEPDKGHIHLVLDGQTLTLLGSLEESLNEFTEGPLEPGPHLLEAEFVAADHGPFSPRVISTVSFTAR
ncbi:MAG TPA: hypothetical protein VG602_03080 [Actinomycetota bacterium]|nr:hypothetical protein [Actinomycetota bacterium]